jgi:hypothetical protein
MNAFFTYFEYEQSLRDIFANGKFNLLANKLNIINSFYGSGKTHIVIDQLKGHKFVFVSPRISLLRQINKRLNESDVHCELYLDVENVIGICNYNSNICITPNSLHKLRINWNEYVLVIDEAVTVFDNLHRLDRVCVDAIQESMIQARSTILLDNNFRELDYNYLSELYNCLIDKNNTLVIQSNYTPTKRQNNIYTNKKQLIKKTIDLLNQNERIIVFSNNKKQANFLKLRYEMVGKNVIVIDSDSRDTIDIANLDDVILQNNYDAVIYTSTMSVGVSIEIENYFNHVIIFDDFNSNSFDETEQAIHRLRDFKIELHCYFSDIKTRVLDSETIYQNIIESESIKREFLIRDYHKQTYDILGNYKPIIKRYCNKKNLEMQFKSNSRYNAVERLSKFCEIVIVENVDTTIEKIESDTKLEEKKLQSTPLIDGAAYKKLKDKQFRNIVLTELESYQIKKYELVTNGNLSNDVINELLEKQTVKNIEKAVEVIHTTNNINDIIGKKSKKILIENDENYLKLRNYRLHRILSDIEFVDKTNADLQLFKHLKEISDTGYSINEKIINMISTNFYRTIKDISKKIENFVGGQLELDEMKLILLDKKQGLLELESKLNLYYAMDLESKNKYIFQLILEYRVDCNSLLLDILRTAGYIIEKVKIGLKNDRKRVNVVLDISKLQMVSTNSESGSIVYS